MRPGVSLQRRPSPVRAAWRRDWCYRGVHLSHAGGAVCAAPRRRRRAAGHSPHPPAVPATTAMTAADDKEAQPPSPMPYKAYAQRWYVLAVYAAASFMGALVWNILVRRPSRAHFAFGGAPRRPAC